MKLSQAKRLKDLEKGNQWLQKLVAELSLDKAMLEEVAKGNFKAPSDADERSGCCRPISVCLSVGPAA